MEIDNYTIAVILLGLSALVGLIIALIWDYYERENYQTRDYWQKGEGYND